MVASILCELKELSSILDSINKAESFGCFVDPTLWMRGIDPLQRHKEIISALLEAQQKIEPARQWLLENVVAADRELPVGEPA